jgi:hypothetical protein
MLDPVLIFSVAFYCLAVIGYVSGVILCFYGMEVLPWRVLKVTCFLSACFWLLSPMFLFVAWAPSDTGAHAYVFWSAVRRVWILCAAIGAAAGAEIVAQWIEEQLHDRHAHMFWSFLLSRAFLVMFASMAFAIAAGMTKAISIETGIAHYHPMPDAEKMLDQRAAKEAQSYLSNASACEFYFIEITRKDPRIFHFQPSLASIFDWTTVNDPDWKNRVGYMKTTARSQELPMGVTTYSLNFSARGAPSCTINIPAPYKEQGFGGADVVTAVVRHTLEERIRQLRETAAASRSTDVFTFAYMSAMDVFTAEEKFLRADGKNAKSIDLAVKWAEILFILVLCAAIFHSKRRLNL